MLELDTTNISLGGKVEVEPLVVSVIETVDYSGNLSLSFNNIDQIGVSTPISLGSFHVENFWQVKEFPTGGGGVSNLNPVDGGKVGINTTADNTNRLAVKSDAVLFSHDDVTPGDGSARLKINKAAADKTASLLFQDNWAAHAEIGLVGGDDLSLKVSPDGSTWHDAFHVDAATGAVAFPNSPSDGNLLINGGFDIWQRGTAFSGVANGYTADRWVLSGSGLWDVSRGLFATGQAAVPGNPSSYLHLLRQGTGATTLAQRIENPSTFSGKTLTLSFWARASAPVTVSARLWCHTAGGSADFEAGAAQPLGLTTTWQHHVVTFDVASFAGKVINDAAGAWLAVELALDNVAAGASVDIAQVRLEEGKTASPFRPRPFDLELMLCQRYFAKSFPYDVAPGPAQLDIWAYMSVAWHAEHASSQAFLFPRPMRTVPTATFYPSLDATAPVGKWHLLHGGFQECDASLSRINSLGMAINVSKAGLGLTPGYGYIIYGFWTVDAEL